MKFAERGISSGFAHFFLRSSWTYVQYILENSSYKRNNGQAFIWENPFENIGLINNFDDIRTV